jgi:hypothetical protein
MASASQPVEIDVPAAVSDLHLLARVDYADAFAIDTDLDHTPEQWLRAFLEGAPKWFTIPWIAVLGAGLLGIDPRVLRRARHVVGWRILHESEDAFAVGLDSPRGLSARLIAVTPPGRAVVATQIELDTAYVRTLWPAVRSAHRFFVPVLLDRAARRLAEAPSPALR